MSSFDRKFDHLKIPLVDIQIATNNFADENLIGQGGFGKKYKGQLLSSGKSIDIVARRLDRNSGQGDREFQTDIMMLSSLNHQNMVTIVGFCDENDERIIINKFEPNRSLDCYLSDPVTLTWTQRLQICLDIARALSYIHYDKQRGFNVIHRNIKSSKILLNENWEAKLSGFGLSIMQPAARRHSLVLDPPCGTMGYVDPAYVRSGGVTHKSDVYSFGMVLFEVLIGRKANERANKKKMLAELAKSHYENGTLDDIIPPVLRKQMDDQSLKVFSEAAYWCLKVQRSQRPNIDRVIYALENAMELQLAHENSGQQSLEDTSIYNWKVNDLEHLKIGYDVIKLATEDFATKYIIGKGGYGSVYKAELECVDSSMINGDGTSELPKRRRTVAIKYITKREDTQGQQGFITEIKTLASCRHPNIVSLLGFCDQHPHLILVYEFVSNGSLDNYLGNRGKMTNLTWLQRIKICIDIAQGLGYIHTTLENKLKIIHRDIKSANILLDKNWEAKIADFGLSKFHPRDNTKSVINTNNIAGTNWYLDPEYESTGNLRKESDVYSFGVVLFEIMSGRLAHDWPVHTSKHENCFAQIVRQHIEEATIMEIIDPNLMEESDVNSFTLRKGPNQESLDTFLKIGCQCLEEKQAQRPTMNVVINELVKALTSQETHKDNLQISFQEIMFATQNFNNQIGCGGFGKVYKGEILSNNGPIPIAVKRLDKKLGQGDQQFLTEIEILSEYKHKNIVDLVGYCNKDGESILVYEYTSNGSLDKHLKDANVTWTQRLKIAIDVAIGLDFLHRGDSSVIHKDLKSSNILLSGDWKAKLTDFGLSMIIPTNNEFDFVSDYVSGTMGYIDPHYRRSGFLTRESDIYSLGVVLFELICGRNAFIRSYHDERKFLDNFVKHCYEQGKVDVLVLESIKHKIAPKSLTTYHRIAYECLHYEREKRPTASEVVLQLKKALEFQEDNEIWAVKLRDYKEIVQMSKVPEKYPDISNKSLYDMVSNGILLQKDKLLFSVNNNGERNEMVSATMFSYENNRLHKRISIQNSRFKRVVKILDISNLNIQIKIKTQFLSPNVIYGAHFVFKFSDKRKTSSKLMYVNLKYQMGSEPLHAYFATCGDDEWMMIELCRFIPHKKDIQFEVLLESLSKYYCGTGAIYVEGIHFQAINDATLKAPEVDEKLQGVEIVLNPDLDSVQPMLVDYEEITEVKDAEKLFFPCKVSEKKCYMLPAKMVLFESSDMKCFNWKSLAESRFQEVAELLSHQLFWIKCKIETQKLSPDTNYACYLVFELSQQCHGLHCPVKVRDVLLRKNKELKFVYFRSPRLVNLHSNGMVPKQREDGLMEVIVWEFNSGNKPSDDHLRMSLKLRCYEGDMCGLMVHGLEFRPV